MKIKFKARFAKEKNKEELLEEEEEIKLAELIGKEYVKEKKYVYETLIQDYDNIVGFNQFDDIHSCLRTKLGEVFIIKGDIETMETRWVDITGESIVEL
jgi:hypothetical protein